MSENKFPDEDIEKLHAAIINAIFKSDEVRPIVQALKDRNKINSGSIFALLFKPQELTNNHLLPAKAKSLSEPEKNRCSVETKGTGQFVDGKELTQNEILFEKFCGDRFDEEKWIAENRIKL